MNWVHCVTVERKAAAIIGFPFVIPDDALAALGLNNGRADKAPANGIGAN